MEQVDSQFSKFFNRYRLIMGAFILGYGVYSLCTGTLNKFLPVLPFGLGLTTPYIRVMMWSFRHWSPFPMPLLVFGLMPFSCLVIALAVGELSARQFFWSSLFMVCLFLLALVQNLLQKRGIVIGLPAFTCLMASLLLLFGIILWGWQKAVLNVANYVMVLAASLMIMPKAAKTVFWRSKPKLTDEDKKLGPDSPEA